MNAAQRTPLVAAVPKMFFPFLVILPGMVILALVGDAGLADAAGKIDYNRALPVLLQKMYPSGLLGLGLAALLASFMSGMAGNVTAFNTVWTYDIYQTYIKPGADDSHYLWMGRMATVFGTLASIGTAYVAMSFNNIMDLLQLVFSFINAPLFATFLLGMFWKRTTANGAFWGLLGGTGAAAVHYALTGVAGAHRIGWLHSYPSDMAQNFWGAIYAWTGCFVLTIADQLLHPAAGREGPRGPRLLADAEAVIRGPRVVPATARARRHRADGVRRFERVLLVDGGPWHVSLEFRVLSAES